MPESYIGLPAEVWHSAGKKFRTQTEVIGGDTVHRPIYTPVGNATYYLWAPSQACAPNKYFLAYMNNIGSGKVRRVNKIFITNTQMTAIASGTAPATVGALEIDVLRITAIVGGTAITANPVDTTDGAMANYTAVYSPTSCVDSTLIFPWYTTNDEAGLTNGFMAHMLQNLISQMFEDDWADFKAFELQPGEGFAVKQITNFTIGSFGVLAVISEEP